MKAHWPLRSCPTLLCLAGAAGALAADPPEPFQEDLIQDRNRLSVAARFSFGISAQVRHLAAPQSTGPDYHDGFVRPDINAGADGQTWYWSYLSEAQVVGDSLEMHTVTGLPSDGRTSESGEDVEAGFEVLYGRELGRFNLGRRRAVWGIEAGISSLNPKLETSDRFTGMVSVRTDSFRLNSIVPPNAPYTGTFQGPGPLLDLNPYASRLDSVSATSNVETALDALLVGIKAGPFLEIPLSDRLQLNLSAGVAGLAAFTDFEFEETASVPGIPDATLTRTGEESETSFEVGGYAQLALSYAVTDFLQLFVGGQYLFLGDVEVSGGGKEATIEFSGAFEAVVGLRTSF